MCRLFGFRSNVVSRAHRSLIQAENAVAQQARRHQDGWGIGYFLGSDAYVHKSHSGAADDGRFQLISERLRSHTFVVHVRNATVGSIDPFNSHPFRHGAWMFAHNGSLWGFEHHRPYLLDNTDDELKNLIFGATDSEHLFYYLLSALRRAGLPTDGRGPVDVSHASEVLRAALGPLFLRAAALGIDPPKLNYILTNGKVFFAQRAGMELYLASQKISCVDFDTCSEPDKVCMGGPIPSLSAMARRYARARRRCNHLIVASEPLSGEDVWEEIPDGWSISLDDKLQLRLHPPIEAFNVSWPHPLKPPPTRPNVIHFQAKNAS
jgi:predicted glutamine amidotransferase